MKESEATTGSVNLELVFTQDLTKELKNRFNSIVIIGIQEKINRNEDYYYHDYAGGISNCLGLLAVMKKILLHNFKIKEDSDD